MGGGGRGGHAGPDPVRAGRRAPGDQAGGQARGDEQDRGGSDAGRGHPASLRHDVRHDAARGDRPRRGLGRAARALAATTVEVGRVGRALGPGGARGRALDRLLMVVLPYQRPATVLGALGGRPVAAPGADADRRVRRAAPTRCPRASRWPTRSACTTPAPPSSPSASRSPRCAASTRPCTTRSADAGRRPVHTSLADRRVLVVGAGGVGTAVARRLEPFEVVAHAGGVVGAAGPPVRRGSGRCTGSTSCPRCCRGTTSWCWPARSRAATRGLMGRELLAAMPDGALLVNVARGPVVDTAALLAELRSGRLRAARRRRRPRAAARTTTRCGARRTCVLTPARRRRDHGDGAAGAAAGAPPARAAARRGDAGARGAPAAAGRADTLTPC